MKLVISALLMLLSLPSAACAKTPPKEEPMDTLSVSSPAFAPGQLIPARFSCDGEDISPPLAWSGGPDATTTFALICDDPDAPAGTWVHWVVFNLPGDTSVIRENASGGAGLPKGSVEGKNSWRRRGYGGPCPPSGTHRYFFRVYALDIRLSLDERATSADVTSAMKGHILATGELMGKYSRK